MFPERLRVAVEELSSIYSLAEHSYKKIQQLLDKIDTAHLLEYRYCARNLQEFVEGLFRGDDEDANLERIHRAIHAMKNAFNDHLDLATDYAAYMFRQLQAVEKARPLDFYVHNLDEVESAILAVQMKIAESRASLQQRVSIYKEILHSPELNTLLVFAAPLNIEKIKERIALDQLSLQRESRRFVLTVMLSCAGILLSLLGILLAYLSLS